MPSASACRSCTSCAAASAAARGERLRAAVQRAAVATPRKARLKAMVETNDGFEIARRDLEIRGPGEFLGARQSGAPLLRFADLARDDALVAAGARAAPSAARPSTRGGRSATSTRWLGGRADYLNA